MIGSTNAETNAFLDQLAADLIGSETFGGVSPGFCHWLRIPVTGGYVGVWDAEEVGERGLLVQALEHVNQDEADDVTFAREMVLVCEHADVPTTLAIIRDYLAGPSVAGRPGVESAGSPVGSPVGTQVEQRQLQPQPQQPGLVRRYGCRVRPRHIP